MESPFGTPLLRLHLSIPPTNRAAQNPTMRNRTWMAKSMSVENPPAISFGVLHFAVRRRVEWYSQNSIAAEDPSRTIGKES
jgi:hypothetical protein